MSLRCSASSQFLFAGLLHILQRDFLFCRAGYSRGCRRSLALFFSWHLHRPFDECWMAVPQVDERETHPYNEIPVFQIPMQWLEPGDLTRYHQRFALTLEILCLRVSALPPLPT